MIFIWYPRIRYALLCVLSTLIQSLDSSLSFKLFIRLSVYCESLELSTIIIVMFDRDGGMEAVLEVQKFFMKSLTLVVDTERCLPEVFGLIDQNFFDLLLGVLVG